MNTEKIFNNTKIAFALKSNSELDRAYYLFKMIANRPLVKIGTTLTNIALKLRLPVTSLIRITVFDHFCGGVNERDCIPTIDSMYGARVCSVLDYSVEGKASENQFDDATERLIKIIEFSEKKDAMPIVVFKPTALGRFYLFQKKGEGKAFTAEEEAEWQRIIGRLDRLCKLSKSKDVEVLIDAEESWMQTAADEIIELMMERYNKDVPYVYNTLQTYRWDRFDFLKASHERAKENGYKLGYKIVRGAYMEKERERAIERGYESPICRDKKTTDDNFNKCQKYILENINDISIFVGTHNEESTYLAMQQMELLNINKEDNRVWFGQLYGMSDHISFNLAAKGYNVAKYLPFGPVKDVMPYLIRRAEENTSVAGQTSRELTLLDKERKRRRA
ncbi:proline dehydrogenase family protein [Lacinutrix sp. 5H-3-7-4]|uniref:proline dehydrogenase family protein n=1 Tax=Lacinutrix sp. (strain 5H-3-7-4) TaxID=983544 RepID=UPI00020A35FD|nr:proline dehydrogenase family protein [Lacinutrix sp. 5H-3-7-4]AEH02252.1 Proline dehydrogenase [Lacinutrix sp. 5H-3-7-4]